jgi:hypothetical protein
MYGGTMPFSDGELGWSGISMTVGFWRAYRATERSKQRAVEKQIQARQKEFIIFMCHVIYMRQLFVNHQRDREERRKRSGDRISDTVEVVTRILRRVAQCEYD